MQEIAKVLKFPRFAPKKGTNSQEIPRNPEKSREIPRNPEKSREIPRNTQISEVTVGAWLYFALVWGVTSNLQLGTYAKQTENPSCEVNIPPA